MNRPPLRYRKRARNPLTDYDARLIAECYYHRKELQGEEASLRARLEQIRKEKHQLTIRMLSKKFSCTIGEISTVLEKWGYIEPRNPQRKQKV